jgi:hypothetical protein
MQFGLAFSFPFQDANWAKKILLMALISLIPVVGPFVLLGWVLEIARRVIANEQPTLPDSIDFGGWLMKGLMGLIISFVYALPLIIIFGCAFTSPMILIAILAALKMDSGTSGMIGMVFMWCFMCIGILLAIAEGIIIPAAMGSYAATGQLGAAFKFGDVIGLVRAAPLAYVLVVVGAIVANIIGGLGTIACIIGVIATQAYAMTIMGHLYGQAYLAAKAKQAAAPAVVA